MPVLHVPTRMLIDYTVCSPSSWSSNSMQFTATGTLLKAPPRTTSMYHVCMHVNGEGHNKKYNGFRHYPSECRSYTTTTVVGGIFRPVTAVGIAHTCSVRHFVETCGRHRNTTTTVPCLYDSIPLVNYFLGSPIELYDRGGACYVGAVRVIGVRG